VAETGNAEVLGMLPGGQAAETRILVTGSCGDIGTTHQAGIFIKGVCRSARKGEARSWGGKPISGSSSGANLEFIGLVAQWAAQVAECLKRNHFVRYIAVERRWALKAEEYQGGKSSCN